MFKQVHGPQNVIFESLCKPKRIERKNTRRKHQSEQFWVAEKPTNKTTKGNGLKPPPLCSFFCRFCCSQNSSNCCLRSRIFSFQSILACRCSQKLHLGDLGLTCKLRSLVALQGQKSKKNGYLRIQGRMQIFEK